MSNEINNRFHFHYFFTLFKPFSFGVDFFFVLSGFILYYIHKNDIGERKQLERFVKKRFVRIFPVYWILLSLALITFILTKTNISNTIYFSPLFILRSYLLFPVAAPILTPAWTLSYEVFFYALFAFFIFFKKTKLLLVLLLIYLALLLPVNFLVPENIIETHMYGGWIQVFIRYFIAEFALGVIASYCFFHLKKFNVKLYLSAIIVSVFFLFLAWMVEIFVPSFITQYRFFTFAIPASFLLFASARFEQEEHVMKNNLLNFFGNASYSIYLMQAFLLLIFFKIIYLISHKVPTQFLLPIGILGIIFCVGVAGVFHLVVEKPLLRKLNR